MSERGAASVAALGVVALALLVAASVGAVGQLLAARLQAGAAADAAALAAAPITFAAYGAAGDAASEAARFAEANGARLVSCHCAPDPSPAPRSVEVVVERRVTVLLFAEVAVRATSRAEFAPPG